MKKILAIVLVLSLVAAFPLAVLADTVDLVNEDIKITVDKAAAAPVIDGKLDADSYKKIDAVVGDFNYSGDESDYMQGNVLDAYISYDANNLYMLLSGDASKFYYCDHDADSAGDIWNQSAIQISLGQNKTIASGSERLEFGLARNSTTGELISNVWAQGSDAHGTTDYEIVFGQNAAISLDGGKLNYEVSVPWTAFLPGAPNVGDTFGMTFLYQWSDEGTRNWREYAAGCASGKDAEKFAQVTLTSNVLEAAPVVVDEPVADVPAADEGAAPVAAVAPTVTPSAVRTGDTGMIILVGVMVIAAIGVVILRKKTAK